MVRPAPIELNARVEVVDNEPSLATKKVLDSERDGAPVMIVSYTPGSETLRQEFARIKKKRTRLVT